MNKRLAWIDALRAIAMILVVWGHQLKGVTEFFVFTSPIKIPLFFAISGYVFNANHGEIKVFFKNWFVKLIIPWLSLALLPQLPRLFLGKVGFLELINIHISGEAVWFMPCFVIGEAIHFFILKYSPKEYLVIIFSIIVSILGFWAHYHDYLNYAMINRAFIVQAFFIIGFVFKRFEIPLIRLPWKNVILIVMLYLSLCVLSLFIFPDSCIDVHNNSYYNIPFCFVLILIGNIALFIIASKSNISSLLLSKIGQNTLVIYIWHEYAIMILSSIMCAVGITINGIWERSILNTVWALVVCYCCAILLNKYAPLLVGKKKRVN